MNNTNEIIEKLYQKLDAQDVIIKEQALDKAELQQKIDKVAFYLGHELYGHILQNDEKSWSPEYYTEGKLDYRKLLIKLLGEVFEILEVDGSKWYEYED